MKSKVNVEELAQRIDFESVSDRLEKLSANGSLKRRKTVADLLEKVKPALLHARAQKASFGALTQFLKENGIPVSEPTLRHYLRAQEGAPVKRKTKRRAVAKKGGSGRVEKTKVAPKAAPEAQPAPAESPARKLPPRLARRA